MIDIVGHLTAIHRAVSRKAALSGEEISVVLRRTYAADVKDVWDALTDPDRLKRWFLPVSGDLRVGGAFQLEGNAGGDILRCESPALLRVTFGAPSSIVEVRLSTEDDATALELEHTVPIEFAGSGAGALYVGPGWDAMLLALALFVRDEGADPLTVTNGPEGLAFSRQSVDAWTTTVEASGTATAEEIAAARAASLAQFAPEPQP